MKLHQIYFSPTGGTKRVSNIVCEALGGEQTKLDLSCIDIDYSCYEFTQEDLCVVAVPSYGGRVPEIAAVRLGKILGGNAKAIPIVVYGNRAYEDTLLELHTILTKGNFNCVGAICAVAEHSILRQFAAGRPDAQDTQQLTQFAHSIKKKLEEDALPKPLNLPGEKEYHQYNGVPMQPKATEKCNRCGLCASQCPVGAIPLDTPQLIEESKCISCMRCIGVCPRGGKQLSKLVLAVAAKAMKKACSKRKENELFLP